MNSRVYKDKKSISAKVKWPVYQWRRSGVYIVNLEQISHIVLVFPLLNLSK